MEIFQETCGPDLAPMHDSRTFAEKIQGNDLRAGDKWENQVNSMGIPISILYTIICSICIVDEKTANF